MKRGGWKDINWRRVWLIVLIAYVVGMILACELARPEWW